MEGYPVNILNNTSNVAIDNPLPIGISINSSNISPCNTVPVGIIINTSNIAPNNPVPSGLVVNNSNVSLLNTVPTSIIMNTSNVSTSNSFPTTIVHNQANVSLQNRFPVIASFVQEQTDAFGRLRISNPVTLFDHFHRYTDDGEVVTYTSNTGSSNFNVNGAYVDLTVGSNAGDRVYRETTRTFAYQPGKSLLVYKSFSMSPPKTGLRQRVGYFDTSNGFYLEQDGSNIAFVRRSMVTGTVHNTVVLQDSWNYDPLKGSGPSGYTLDLTRTQIFYMDVEWLGVGSSRMGFVINGKYCICHVFHHANQPSSADADTTLPYMTTACLPIRMEIENTAATGSYSTMRTICTSIISEGGYELSGRNYSAGQLTIDAPITILTKNTFYPLISLRLKSDRLGAIVIPVDFSIMGTTASDFRWALIKNATLDSTGWTSANNHSSVEYKYDGGAITDGIVLKSGYFAAATQSGPSISLTNSFKFQLERNTFTGTAFPFTLAVAAKQANDKALGSIDWEELT